jgi:hypothetical protein
MQDSQESLAPYPSNKMEEIEDIIEIEEKSILEKNDGKNEYLESCNEQKIIPVTYLIKRLQDSEVNLSHRGVGDKGAISLANCLKVNNYIEFLDLTDNWIGEEGGIAIAESLSINCNLKKISLHMNRLGLKGGEAIATFLAFNEHIEEIILSNNQFDDRVAQFFAKSIQQKSRRPTLRKIDLR